MSERDVFEAWFAQAFGPRPPGDAKTLRADIDTLRRVLAFIEEWEVKHDAALAAWHERHGRDHGHCLSRDCLRGSRAGDRTTAQLDPTSFRPAGCECLCWRCRDALEKENENNQRGERP